MAHIDIDFIEQTYVTGTHETIEDDSTMSFGEQENMDDACCYVNAATCPDCGAGMVRLGTCFTCPLCGWGSCG